MPRVRGRLPSVPPGDRRGRLPGAGRTRARRHHRARALPLRRGRRARPVPAAPALLRPQGHREALRAAAVAPRHLPRRVDLRRHGGRATRSPTRTRSSGSPAVEVPPRARAPARRAAGARAHLQPHRGHRRARDRRRLHRPREPRAGAARAARPRCRTQLFGTRLLRGTIALGGVKRDLPPTGADALRAHLRGFEKRVRRPGHAAHRRGHASPTASTAPGSSPNQAARDLGDRRAGRARLGRRRGPAPRPSARRLRRAALRGARSKRAATSGRGSWCARGRSSSRSSILHQVLDALPDAPLAGAAARRSCPRARRRSGGPRRGAGRACTGSRPTTRGELARVKVTDPSFLNWPGLVQAVPGNIIPDFPVINKSFNLSYSGNDR